MKLYKVLLFSVLFAAGVTSAASNPADWSEEEKQTRSTNLAVCRLLAVNSVEASESYEQLEQWYAMLESSIDTLSAYKSELFTGRCIDGALNVISGVFAGLPCTYAFYYLVDKCGPQFLINIHKATFENMPGGKLGAALSAGASLLIRSEITAYFAYKRALMPVNKEINNYTDLMQKIEQKLQQAS